MSMKTQIKNELHQLIDNCENEVLLTEAKELFKSETSSDWWDEMSETDRALILKSEIEYKEGKFTKHAMVMQELHEWIKK
jgi:hypothetical protein